MGAYLHVLHPDLVFLLVFFEAFWDSGGLWFEHKLDRGDSMFKNLSSIPHQAWS